MESNLILGRNERIKMFLYEYYFGNLFLFTFFRLTGGPVLLYLGIDFYYRNDRFAIAYGGFMLAYGVYYTLKPLIWILTHKASLKSVNLSVSIADDRIKIRDESFDSEILFSGIDKLYKRRFYWVMLINKTNKLYLPDRCFDDKAKEILSSKLKIKGS